MINDDDENSRCCANMMISEDNDEGIEDYIANSNISTTIPYYSLGELVWKSKNLSYKLCQNPIFY